jgi:hypothetical protein
MFGSVKRTQIYLDEELGDQLRAAADAEGRSAAAIVREAVVRYLAERHGRAGGDPFLELAGAFPGGPADGAERHDRDLYGTDATMT